MPIPFQYDQLEDEIVDRLTATVDDVAAVAPLPETEEKIKNAVDAAVDNNKVMVLVAYTGSDFGPSTSASAVNQEESMSVLLNLQSNLLRGEKGIYNVIRLIKNSLLGYQTAGGGRLKMKSIDFDDRDEKQAIFSYNVVFTVTKLQAQILSDGEDNTSGKPSLTQTTFTDAYR